VWLVELASACHLHSSPRYPEATMSACEPVRTNFLISLPFSQPLRFSVARRAEDWNLAQPLKTCRLLVEQRGDALILEFAAADTGALFCQGRIDLAKNPDQKTEQWLEQVVDSSRYFVVKIQGDGKREALIGFGFRDRDRATDLRESVQHYERSMRRDKDASKLGEFHVPKMEEGQKIHIAVKGSGGKSTITKASSSGGGGKKSGSVPLLKKKPPSSPKPDDPAPAVDGSQAVEKLSINLGDIDLDADKKSAAASGGGGTGGGDDDGENSAGGSSGGAVYAGDEDQWATEFAMK